jgi:hypothetical protein
MDSQSFGAFQKKFARVRMKDAAQAVADARRLLQEHTGDLTPSQTRLVYQEMALAYAKNLKDHTTALTTLEEGLQKLATSPEQFDLLDTKATLLLAAGKPEEARDVLDAAWPQAVAARSTTVLIGSYVAALNRCDQGERALEALQQVATARLDLFYDDFPPPHMKLLLDQLMTHDQAAQAESWAKLSFLLCAYNARSLATVTGWLSSAWMAKYGSPAKVAELTAALRNPDAPSPLREIPLPALDAASLGTRADKTTSVPRRVVLLLALGRDHDAMAAARGLMLDKPLSEEGILEVCRVFKAHDLNFKRANAFLEFCKTGQGENPVTAFLKETEAK